MKILLVKLYILKYSINVESNKSIYEGKLLGCEYCFGVLNFNVDVSIYELWVKCFFRGV